MRERMDDSEPPRKREKYDVSSHEDMRMNTDVDDAEPPACTDAQMLSTMVETSSLSSLTSISTPSTTSFYTAKASPPFNGDVSLTDVTNISTPEQDRPDLEYRRARRIPYEVRNQIQVQFEEKLYASSVRNLNSLTTAGAVPKGGTAARRAAVVAPAKFLALLANFVVHPAFTTRPAEPESKRTAADALQHLEHLLFTVGPINANFRAAFKFSGGRQTRHHSDRGGRSDDASDSEDDSWDDSDDSSGRIPLANQQSIWKRAYSFWSVVGWAFHCAKSYPHRWPYWRLWLEFMLDVLERDWAERLRQDEDAQDSEYSSLRKSLIMDYLGSKEDNTAKSLRDLTRAIFAFADASTTDKAVYKEIFVKETTIKKPKTSRKRKRTSKLDIEHDDYADYLNDDSDEDLSDAEEGQSGAPLGRARLRGRKKKEVGPAPFQMTPALAETVPIRARLFALLSVVSDKLQDAVLFKVADLYERFADTTRGLPLSMFAEFIDSGKTPLISVQYVSLLRNIIDELLPNTGIPQPEDVDPATDNVGGFSQIMLEECFLPFPARSIFVEVNAKLSLVLEHIMRYIWLNHTLTGTDNLRIAVEDGIKARENKTRSRKRTVVAAEGKTAESLQEQAAREVMAQSAANMKLVVTCLEIEATGESTVSSSS